MHLVLESASRAEGYALGLHDAGIITEYSASNDVHRLETVEKSAFGRKALSRPGYGPKYGLNFFLEPQKRKSPE
ncbi:hypothetical protein [Pseudomonas sp. ZB1P45]|uniref:hypothetical protein n=1 Tax=Pseudomonas frigoris TaxID=3398356 RepID=UPI0039F0680D